jgi:hypothetical protein
VLQPLEVARVAGSIQVLSDVRAILAEAAWMPEGGLFLAAALRALATKGQPRDAKGSLNVLSRHAAILPLAADTAARIRASSTRRARSRRWHADAAVTWAAIRAAGSWAVR